jgi:hypothetical protein
MTPTGRLLVTVAVLLLSGSPAQAVQNIFSCDNTQAGNFAFCPSGTCVLITDIVCDPANPNHQGIKLDNGADLDMKGWDISCKAGSTCTYPAVRMENGSILKNTGASESAITGVFSGDAVDCHYIYAGGGSAKVDGIKVNVTAARGIGDCQEVQNSVVLFSNLASVPAAAGIHLDVGLSTGGAHDNYIDGWPGSGVRVTYNNGKPIDHNLIVVRDYSGVASYGISVSNSAASESVTDNVLFGESTLGGLINVVNTPNITISGNSCDPNTASCLSCVGAGRCVGTPTAPFSF